MIVAHTRATQGGIETEGEQRITGLAMAEQEMPGSPWLCRCPALQ